MIQAQIKILPKSGVHNPEGQTLTRCLKDLGFMSVQNVQTGKYIELTLSGITLREADAYIKAMSEQLLANPVIETFQYVIKEI